MDKLILSPFVDKTGEEILLTGWKEFEREEKEISEEMERNDTKQELMNQSYSGNRNVWIIHSGCPVHLEKKKQNLKNSPFMQDEVNKVQRMRKKMRREEKSIEMEDGRKYDGYKNMWLGWEGGREERKASG